MKKIKLYIYAIMALATIFAVYAQDISYYIDNTFDKISPLYCLRILTLISIILFLMPPILITRLIKNEKVEHKEFTSYFIINSLIGVVFSIFSLFVLFMWWS